MIIVGAIILILWVALVVCIVDLVDYWTESHLGAMLVTVVTLVTLPMAVLLQIREWYG